jgi:hypothetical protein
MLINQRDILSSLIMINKGCEDLNDIIDKVSKDRGINISDNRAEIAKDMVNAARTTMLAYNDAFRPGKLTTAQQRVILQMVDDVLTGKREAVQFQLNRNCDGIKEVFSRKTLIINEKEKG